MSCLRHITTAAITANLEAVSFDASWHAVQTRPRHEKEVAADLAEKGVSAFLPIVAEQRQWSDRRRLIHMPLFTRYVF
jgi:hypothetical protein